MIASPRRPARVGAVGSLELSAADLLGAASAWGASHPGECWAALEAVCEAARVSGADPRRAEALGAIRAALRGNFPGERVPDRLAELAAVDGPRAVTRTLRKAAELADLRAARRAVRLEPRDMTRDEAKAERRATRAAWEADAGEALEATRDRLAPLAAAIAADYLGRFGVGPSGSEVAAKLGLPPEHAGGALCGFAESGWLAPTADLEGELRCGERWEREGEAWRADQLAAQRGPGGYQIEHAPKRAKAKRTA